MSSSLVAPLSLNGDERSDTPFDLSVASVPTPASSRRQSRPGVLAWSAWQRAAAVTPALLLLWWAVAWAMKEVAPL